MFRGVKRIQGGVVQDRVIERAADVGWRRAES